MLPGWQVDVQAVLPNGKIALMNDDLDHTLSAVGPRLKRLRLRRDVTLADLAEQTGISASTLSRLEAGLRRPTLEQLLPLARVASGGELARVSLALKARLAAADRTPVLVFDEVDAEVGGRLGPAVAGKLRAVSAGRQVLVVTHLASIAAAADQHLRVTKEVAGGRTTAAVEELSGEDRVRELAEMLHGEGRAAKGLDAARDLLKVRPPRRAR